MRIKPEPVILALAAAGAVAFLAAGLRKSGGLPAPAVASTTEGSWNIPDSVAAVLCLPDEHTGEVIFAKHRYPNRVGGELTTVMHYGHSALSVPNVKDVQWITSPPSEVTL